MDGATVFESGGQILQAGQADILTLNFRQRGDKILLTWLTDNDADIFCCYFCVLQR